LKTKRERTRNSTLAVQGKEKVCANEKKGIRKSRGRSPSSVSKAKIKPWRRKYEGKHTKKRTYKKTALRGRNPTQCHRKLQVKIRTTKSAGREKESRWLRKAL